MCSLSGWEGRNTFYTVLTIKEKKKLLTVTRRWWSEEFKAVAEVGWFVWTRRFISFAKQPPEDPVLLALISFWNRWNRYFGYFLACPLVRDDTFRFALHDKTHVPLSTTETFTRRKAGRLPSRAHTCREQNSTEWQFTLYSRLISHTRKLLVTYNTLTSGVSVCRLWSSFADIWA